MKNATIRMGFFRNFFIIPFKPQKVWEQPETDIKFSQLLLFYFLSTVILSVVLKICAQIIVGRSLDTFQSTFHYLIYLFQNTTVFILLDFLFYFGVKYVIAGKSKSITSIISLKIIVLTNLPVLIGSFITSILTLIPVYLLMVIWKFLVIRVEIKRILQSVRQSNVTVLLLFTYYAVLYFFISKVLWSLLVAVQRGI